jgi:peptidoglycan/xylan/chitin deacetylase (PgdA/CDA1 family)
MNAADSHKHFVIALVAVFFGTSFFSVLTKFNTVDASRDRNLKTNMVGADEDHVDDLKQINPSQMVGTTTPPAKYATTTQYVLISFDGSKSIQSWEDVLNFSQEMKNNGVDMHFSFFINAAYFLSYGTKQNYISPDGKVRGSAIGYSDTRQGIADRIVQVNRAIREGHEIGSHTTGHNDGSKWSVDQWAREFDSFDYILSNIQKLNPDIVLKEQPLLNVDNTVGFRAPNLGINNNLYSVLYQRKFLYDASQIARQFTWPFKDAQGLWHIPLGMVKNKYGGSVLAMDYNWWVYQTGAKDLLWKGTLGWESAKKEVFNAYKNYFDSHYNGNKAPLSIGHHFSMWNDGLYWEALKDFARYACSQKNVRCISHKEFVDAMEGI